LRSEIEVVDSRGNPTVEAELTTGVWVSMLRPGDTIISHHADGNKPDTTQGLKEESAYLFHLLEKDAGCPCKGIYSNSEYLVITEQRCDRAVELQAMAPSAQLCPVEPPLEFTRLWSSEMAAAAIKEWLFGKVIGRYVTI
jgi:hypothetical protein